MPVTIPLIQQTPVADPLQNMARVLQYKNALAQQPLIQQQIQAGQLDIQGKQLLNQQTQTALSSQKVLDSAMQGAITQDADGNPIFKREAVIDHLTKSGFGHLVPGVLKQLTDSEKSFADLNKAKNDVIEGQQKIAAYQTDALGSLGLSVRAANNDPTAAIAAVGFALAHKSIDAQTANGIVQKIQANPTPDAVKALVEPLIAASPKAQESLKNAAQGVAAAASANKTNAELPGVQADAEAKQLTEAARKLSGAKSKDEYASVWNSLPAGIAQNFDSPQNFQGAASQVKALRLGMTPDQVVTTSQTAAHNAVEEQQGQRRTNIEAGNLRLRQQEFQQRYGNTLDGFSEADKASIDSMVRGDTALPSASSRAPGAFRLREAAIQLGADDARYKAVQQFKTGKDSTNLGGITRVLGHLEQYDNLSQKHGADLLLRANATGEQKQLHIVTSAIGDEFGKLVKGNALTQGEADRAQENLLSPFPDVRAQAVQQVRDLLGSQFEAIFQKYKSATGQDLPVSTYFDAPSQKRLAKQYPDLMRGTQSQSSPGPGAAARPAPAGSVNITDPTGGVHTFPNQAAADNFKRLAGIK